MFVVKGVIKMQTANIFSNYRVYQHQQFELYLHLSLTHIFFTTYKYTDNITFNWAAITKYVIPYRKQVSKVYFTRFFVVVFLISFRMFFSINYRRSTQLEVQLLTLSLQHVRSILLSSRMKTSGYMTSSTFACSVYTCS